MTDFPASLQIGDQVIFQSLRDEAILLNLKSQVYYGLDDVGARMWQLILEYGDVESVISALKVEYAVDEQLLRRDVCSLTAELVAVDLLRAV